MSRNHLRVSAQANNERYESEIVRDIMNKATNDYARSEAITEPIVTPVTKAPVKGPTTVRLTKDVRMEAEIDDLRKELVGSMEARDAQAECIRTMHERIASLKETITLNANYDAKALEAANREIRALKALVRVYVS